MTVPGSWYQPKLLRLAGGGEIPQTVVHGHDCIARFVNDQQRSRADLADDLHGSDAIDVNSRSVIGDRDRQRSERKSRKVNKVFKAGRDYARRIAESGIVDNRADTFVFRRAENSGGRSHRDTQHAKNRLSRRTLSAERT